MELSPKGREAAGTAWLQPAAKHQLPTRSPKGWGPGRQRLQGWALRAGLGCSRLPAGFGAAQGRVSARHLLQPVRAGGSSDSRGAGGGLAPKPKRQSRAPEPPPPHGACCGASRMAWRHPRPHVSRRRRCHMRRPVAPCRKGVRRRVQAGFKSPSRDRLVSALALSHPAVPMAPAVPLALLAVGLGLGLALPGCDYPTHLWCSSREIAIACQVRAAGPVLVPSGDAAAAAV